jgi:hypothetical protein
MGLMEQINQIAKELPESELAEVRDFAEFLRARQQSAAPRSTAGANASWQTFFDRHGRTVGDTRPLPRDELYADRLS